MTVDGFIRRAQSSLDRVIPTLVNYIVMMFLLHDRWDEDLLGPLLSLNQHTHTVTMTGGDLRREHPQSAFLCNVVDRGQYKWRFQWTKLKYALYWSSTIGIWKCSQGFSPQTNGIFTLGEHVAYGFAANAGTLVDPSSGSGGDGGTRYGAPCSDNDIVEMCIDLDRLELGYTINGKDYGPAFEIEKTAYRAAVNMCKLHDSIRIIHDVEIESGRPSI